MGAPNGSTSIAATRFPSHQLSSGLYVSGHPDQYKDRSATMSVPQMPYTGGDVKKSGELGKMFDIPVENSSSAKLRRSGSATGPLNAVGCAASTSHSGPLPIRDSLQSASVSSGLLGTTMSWQNSKSGSHVSKSGPLVGNRSSAVRQSSKSGPLTRSGNADPPGPGTSRMVPGMVPLTSASGLVGAGTTVGSVSTGQLASALPATGLITFGPLSSGILTSTGVQKMGPSGPLDSNGVPAKHISGAGGTNQAITNLSRDQEHFSRRSFPKVILWTVIPLFVMGFIAGAFIIATVQNAVLLIIVAGLFVAVALLFLWNKYWRPRSVTGFLVGFSDSELGTANDGQFVKVTGKQVADFYVSDLQSGLRALVKAGYGAQVTAYVEESAVVDIPPICKEVPPHFLCWLSERNLSTSDRAMRLKEGYIKEGSTVTVCGIIQRNENVLTIVPPPKPMSTGCRWSKLLFPSNLKGLILTCHDITKNEGIPL